MASASIFDILNAQWVKDVFLQGVDLTDDNGVAFPDEMLESALRSAVSSIEQSLDVVIDPVVMVGERRDLTERERQAYWPFYLQKRPLISVTKLAMNYGNSQIAEIPIQWVTVLKALHSYGHIIPQQDQITKITQIFVPSTSTFRWDYIPGWFTFDYKAGFRVYTGTLTIPSAQQTGTVTFDLAETFQNSNYFCMFGLVNPNVQDADIVPYPTARLTTGMTIKLSRVPANNLTVRWYATDLPGNLRQLIGLRAARPMLATAGDLVMGAGIAGMSIGIDGLSQNRSTTKSAAGGAFAGRIKDNDVQEELILQGLRAAFRSINFGAI